MCCWNGKVGRYLGKTCMCSLGDVDFCSCFSNVWICSCSRDVKKPLFTRETTPEYFSTYLGGIVNQQSLKEFFNITNNQYRSTCDAWYRKYLNSQFNKALVFAYDHKNIKGVTSYWGFSNNSPSRRMAEQHALQACEASDVKIESHICAILFSNNEITNKDYFALAKLVIPE